MLIRPLSVIKKQLALLQKNVYKSIKNNRKISGKKIMPTPPVFFLKATLLHFLPMKYLWNSRLSAVVQMRGLFLNIEGKKSVRLQFSRSPFSQTGILHCLSTGKFLPGYTSSICKQQTSFQNPKDRRRRGRIWHRFCQGCVFQKCCCRER